MIDSKARAGKMQDELRTSYGTIKDGSTSKNCDCVSKEHRVNLKELLMAKTRTKSNIK